MRLRWPNRQRFETNLPDGGRSLPDHLPPFAIARRETLKRRRHTNNWPSLTHGVGRVVGPELPVAHGRLGWLL